MSIDLFIIMLYLLFLLLLSLLLLVLLSLLLLLIIKQTYLFNNLQPLYASKVFKKVNE